MMVRWLPETKSTIPPNASSYVGVGAFVVNDRDEVLVVKEKSGPAKGRGGRRAGLVLREKFLKRLVLKPSLRYYYIDSDRRVMRSIRVLRDFPLLF